MRQQPSIPDDQLRACLQADYGLTPVVCEFLPLGLDYHAGVYRVVTAQGTPYLVKVKSGSFYAPGCLAPRYLHDQGIVAVVAPIPTTSGALWVQLGDWTVIVYPFIAGDTSWRGMTDAQWQAVGATFGRIHQVTPPSEGWAALRTETFDPTEYTRWVATFEGRPRRAQDDASAAERALRSAWATYRPTIDVAVTAMETLGRRLRTQSGSFVLCHADLHPANLLRDQANHVYVIDWDEVMLAPKERDFIYVRGPQAEAFFQGYGKTAIDWVALTYYRWERVIQDVIECAQSVCFRDDWDEATRADALQLFEEIVTAKDGDIAAAQATAAHLPADLA